MSVVERVLEKLRKGQTGDTGTLRAPPPQAIGAIVNEPEHESRGPRIAIDREAVRAAGYLPDTEQDRRFADEYRQIKRPILANAFAADAGVPSPRLVMMASALPGDGKTFTSINLALSMARERNSTVVLVDGDVAKPHISRIFGVQDERGLLDALADPTVEVGSLILRTEVAGLSILPAGRVRDGATELLASSRMAEVATQILARQPRCIALFDSTPLLVSTESRALAATMGQVILVVRAAQTPRNALTEALRILEERRGVSLVLNQGRRGLLGGYQGYAYGNYGDEQP